MLFKVSSLNWYKKKWGGGVGGGGVTNLVLELYMLENSLLRVQKKALFASSHTYFSNKKYQNDVKKNQKNTTLNQPRWYLM